MCIEISIHGRFCPISGSDKMYVNNNETEAKKLVSDPTVEQANNKSLNKGKGKKCEKIILDKIAKYVETKNKTNAAKMASNAHRNVNAHYYYFCSNFRLFNFYLVGNFIQNSNLPIVSSPLFSTLTYDYHEDFSLELKMLALKTAENVKMK